MAALKASVEAARARKAEKGDAEEERETPSRRQKATAKAS
jgi:hypothetical protein